MKRVLSISRGALVLSRAFILLAVITSPLLADPPLTSGLDRADFDTTIKPGDDFFRYVNGGWLKRNPVPPQYHRWDVDSEVRERNLAALREILDGLVQQKDGLDDEQRKLRDLYLTATDEGALQKQGAKTLADEWERIAKVKSTADLYPLLAEFRERGLDFAFSLSIDQDEKQSTRYAVHLWQGGLGLPEREYYLDATDDAKKIRDQYREHVAKMLTLLGDAPEAAAAGAAAILEIETKLAEGSRTPTELRDAEANYNKKTLAELTALAPGFPWEKYLKAIGVTDTSDVIVGQPEFFEKLDALIKSTPVDAWRTYLRWHLINVTADYLNPPFEQEHFRFYSGVLRGVKEMKPRWKRAIETVDQQMGEALGKLYVEKHFPPEAKRRMEDMVVNITAAFKQRVETRDWMSPGTRKQALIKLAAMTSKIGYPVKWRDYAPLEIRPDSYVRNVLRGRAYESHFRIGRLHDPVDRDEWEMTTPTVNAYYNTSRNEFVFPAGILQPPFFDARADDAVNYGATGAVIGHEMTHGFDDQGSRSDANGNLHNWWSLKDRARFMARSARLVKQMSACVAVDDLHVNGELTLGENLADLGGVMIAYDAYIKSRAGKPAPIIDGFSGPQRFFLGYAMSWRGHTRDATARMLVRTDPHAPVNFRVLIPLSNVPAFYEAFDLKPADAMYRKPEDRVEVW